MHTATAEQTAGNTPASTEAPAGQEVIAAEPKTYALAAYKQFDADIAALREADKAAKVDGIVAMIIGMHCALDHPPSNGSFGFRSF